MSIKVIFTPDHVEVMAEAGEPILNVADRAGVHIPTGCLAGSCRACEVEIDGDPICACISGIPGDSLGNGQGKRTEVTIDLYEDALW
jgi:aerobic-type carbon monoxide dehydrogenase small subunit (CoxS/CutS family)